MQLSQDEVRRIAELAKLDLTDAEIDLYAGQLSAILGYFERLQQVDTSQIPPTASVLPLHNVMRPDTPAAPLPVDEVLRNASDSVGAQFRVSAVLGDE